MFSVKPNSFDAGEGRDDRERDGGGGDQRRAPVAQDQEHDQARQQRAFDQRVDRAFVHAADEFDGGGDLA